MSETNSKFFETMAAFGYKFLKQEEGKLYFQKKHIHCGLLLVFNINQKYINPMVFPNSVVKNERELIYYKKALQMVYEDAEHFVELTHGTYFILR